ncbi:hypothetical protein P7K49_034223 [Saguinus oedipus]|uniref:Uncharacterized protein n=1 Tax=Saguinus oedipus TaxID=9490 RepID=A0ABQ9TU44_SAGOE|nr:hypothetical protein P7K49_034223 [Saguinus oedipus]
MSGSTDAIAEKSDSHHRLPNPNHSSQRAPLRTREIRHRQPTTDATETHRRTPKPPSQTPQATSTPPITGCTETPVVTNQNHLKDFSVLKYGNSDTSGKKALEDHFHFRSDF